MSDNRILISVVSPVYRGEKMVGELVRRVSESVRTITYDYEIIHVNDTSKFTYVAGENGEAGRYYNK